MNSLPHGWHETRDTRVTTFTFRSTSLVRAIVTSAVLSPLPILASMMTIAGARAGNWGWDWILVALFDALALFVVFMVANMFNRTRIVVDEASVEWRDGPLLATRVRMTYDEAKTIRATERRAGRTTYLKLDFLRANVPVGLGTTLDDWDRANFVVDRIQTELTRH